MKQRLNETWFWTKGFFCLTGGILLQLLMVLIFMVSGLVMIIVGIIETVLLPVYFLIWLLTGKSWYYVLMGFPAEICCAIHPEF